MQQAARVADYTGFFLMRKLIEFDETKKMYTKPAKKETEDYITGRFGYSSCSTSVIKTGIATAVTSGPGGVV
jgi:hypothetical protein